MFNDRINGIRFPGQRLRIPGPDAERRHFRPQSPDIIDEREIVRQNRFALIVSGRCGLKIHKRPIAGQTGVPTALPPVPESPINLLRSHVSQRRSKHDCSALAPPRPP